MPGNVWLQISSLQDVQRLARIVEETTSTLNLITPPNATQTLGYSFFHTLFLRAREILPADFRACLDCDDDPSGLFELARQSNRPFSHAVFSGPETERARLATLFPDREVEILRQRPEATCLTAPLSR